MKLINNIFRFFFPLPKPSDQMPGFNVRMSRGGYEFLQNLKKNRQKKHKRFVNGKQ